MILIDANIFMYAAGAEHPHKAPSVSLLRCIALGEIVLAHPDVDQDRFRQLAKGIKDLAPRMTLYTSRNDRAAWASKVLGGAGRAGGERIVVPSVDTIDISKSCALH